MRETCEIIQFVKRMSFTNTEHRGRVKKFSTPHNVEKWIYIVLKPEKSHKLWNFHGFYVKKVRKMWKTRLINGKNYT